jgi:hypothetical protein
MTYRGRTALSVGHRSVDIPAGGTFGLLRGHRLEEDPDCAAL